MNVTEPTFEIRWQPTEAEEHWMRNGMPIYDEATSEPLALVDGDAFTVTRFDWSVGVAWARRTA